MKQPLLFASLSLAVLLSAGVLAQNPVDIQFQTDPLSVQTGNEIVFTVLTVSRVLSMEWKYQGVTLGFWTGGNPTINPVPQFQGRVTISATQLRIGGAQLRDAGSYTVEVTPLAPTDLVASSKSIQLSVFDAVAGVNLIHSPSISVEGRNISLSCTWTSGTEVTTQWGKDGVAITADSRITISVGSLVINPARRSDTGDYTCTASNPVSAQTATKTVTVYYGPDTPVLTKEAPKKCVGGGDVAAGQTVRFTCLSDSLPPALFSWQRDGQPVATSPPDSGVLTLQTFSTNESGQLTCTARNSLTGGTSVQRTTLAVVATCLNDGEVAGIVIACLVLIIIIALLIWLIVFLVRKRRAREMQKNNPNPRPIPAEPQTNGASDLGQGPHPPLYHSGARHDNHTYRSPRENRDNQVLRPNGLQNTNVYVQRSAPQHISARNNNNNSFPPDGIDNPAFMHTEAQNAQQQNPNILIQAGQGQGGAQPAAVQVSLNTLPQTAQQNNNNAQVPTIHVNLNSYPANGQQVRQEGSAPNNIASQNHPNFTDAGQSYPVDPRLNGDIRAGHQVQNGLIPTGYTHLNGSNTLQRNANTQTYQQEPEHQRGPDRNRGRHATGDRSSRQQMPWDRYRGTPAYPRGTSPEHSSYTSDYNSNPPVREERATNRSQPPPPSQTISRSEGPPRHDVLSLVRQIRSRTVDRPVPSTGGEAQLEAPRHTHGNPHTQRESAQRDIRASSGSRIAPRQDVAHGNNPQARPLTSRQASVDHSAVSQGPVSQQGLSALQGADTRALADPNHLPQAHMAQQHRAAPAQKPTQGPGTQTQAVINDARQPRQGGTAPAQLSPAQPNPSNLTQAALKVHTQRSQTFQNRRQQTQAALLHPGTQARPPATKGREPPTPPPVIPLAQFQTLPQHKSPTRGPQPPRPPANIPAAQRHQQARQRPATQQHRHGTMPTAARHHAVNGHMHATAQRRPHPHAHARGHGHPAHFTHQQQQQAHRGRPR